MKNPHASLQQYNGGAWLWGKSKPIKTETTSPVQNANVDKLVNHDNVHLEENEFKIEDEPFASDDGEIEIQQSEPQTTKVNKLNKQNAIPSAPPLENKANSAIDWKSSVNGHVNMTTDGPKTVSQDNSSNSDSTQTATQNSSNINNTQSKPQNTSNNSSKNRSNNNGSNNNGSNNGFIKS